MIRAYENRWFPLIRQPEWGTLGGAWLISFKKLKQVKQRNAVLLAEAAGAPKISEAPKPDLEAGLRQLCERMKMLKSLMKWPKKSL